MDISRLKKAFAGASAAAMFVSQMGVAIAAYSDVPSGAWYEDAVNTFVDAGYLDASQANFRGGDLANRAEFVKLVVELNGGILASAPAVPSFADVAPGTWYYGYFEEAGREGWVRGDNACYGTTPCFARPSANINRAEAAAIINRAFGLEGTGDAAQFVDNPSGQWYTNDIQTAADFCVLQGDDSTGRVRPGDNMNRAEMVVMLNRVDQNLLYGQDCGEVTGEPMVKDVVPTSSKVIEVEYNTPIDQTAATDVAHYSVTGDSELQISSIAVINNDTVEITLVDNMVAGEDYTLVVEDMMTTDGTVFSDSVIFSGYTDIVLGNGTLEVSLSSNNPLGDTIPKGAVGVVMTSIDLTASDDDVIIENITILHEGFGDSANISGVYGVINGERVTRKRTLDSSTTTATVRFTKPLVIRRGETVTLDIAADFTTSGDTSSEHSLTVELPSDFQANSQSVTGNFPIRGNIFRLAAVSAGTISVTYRSVTPTQVEVGDKGVKIGKFEIDIDSTEDQTIYSMTVENDGTASDGEFVNLKVSRTDGTIITNTVAQTVADFATFVFDPPFTVLEGDSVTLNVVADIVDGAAKNVKIEFDEASDIFAVGSLYGYGVNGQLYGSQVAIASTPSASTINIDAGQFTINIDGPISSDYTPDDDNVVLANIEMETGGEDIDVEEMYIAIQGISSTGGSLASQSTINTVLEGVEVRNISNGRTISGVRLTGSTASAATSTGSWQIYRFDDFIVKGSETYEFRVDFNNTGLTSGDRFRIHLCGEPTDILSSGTLTTNTTGCTFGGLIGGSTAYQMKVRGVSTNDRVGDVRPRGTITGNYHDIKTAALTITGKPLATSDTAVKNSDDVNLLRFEARASEAKDILLTDLVFDTASSGSGSLNNGNNYTLWVDSNGDGNVDTILESGVASQDSKVTFDEFIGGGWVIPKDTTVVFEVHSDISASLTNNWLQINFSTGASTTYVQAEEVDDGSSLSVSAGTITVTVATSTIYSLRSSGDLYVTKSDTSIRNRQLLGGTLTESAIRLQLRAQYEDIDVTDLVFTASGANASNISKNVQRLELYKAGETTPFANATAGACKTGSPSNSLCVSMNAQQLVVPRGNDIEILARPRMNTDQQGAVRGNIVQFFIDPTATSSSGTGAVRARGLQSSTDLAANDTDANAEGEVFIGTSTAAANARIVAKSHSVVLAKVTSITNASPDADGTAIPTGVDKVIGQFKFAAAANDNTKDGTNDWVLSGVVFNVNATNALLDASSFNIYNKSDQNTKKACTASVASASGSFTVLCDGLVGDSVNTSIDGGTFAEFALEADITDPNTGTAQSTLQVSLSSFTDKGAETFSRTTSHISWVDDDGGTDATFRWVDYPEASVNSTSYRG